MYVILWWPPCTGIHGSKWRKASSEKQEEGGKNGFITGANYFWKILSKKKNQSKKKKSKIRFKFLFLEKSNLISCGRSFNARRASFYFPPSLNISKISLGPDFVPPKSYWVWTWCRQHLKNFIGQARVNPTDQFITGANYFHKSLSIKKSKNQKKKEGKIKKSEKERTKNQKIRKKINQNQIKFKFLFLENPFFISCWQSLASAAHPYTSFLDNHILIYWFQPPLASSLSH